VSGGDLFIHLLGGFERAFGREQQIGVRLRILAPGMSQGFAGELDGAEGLAEQVGADRFDGMRPHRSITLGTLK
jgi:hypothetical protein